MELFKLPLIVIHSTGFCEGLYPVFATCNNNPRYIATISSLDTFFHGGRSQVGVDGRMLLGGMSQIFTRCGNGRRQ